MSTPVRLAAFALGLVVAFAASFGVGRAVGPSAVEDPRPAHDRPGATHP